jgi:hypothetical protein
MATIYMDTLGILRAITSIYYIITVRHRAHGPKVVLTRDRVMNTRTSIRFSQYIQTPISIYLVRSSSFTCHGKNCNW